MVASSLIISLVVLSWTESFVNYKLSLQLKIVFKLEIKTAYQPLRTIEKKEKLGKNVLHQSLRTTE